MKYKYDIVNQILKKVKKWDKTELSGGTKWYTSADGSYSVFLRKKGLRTEFHGTGLSPDEAEELFNAIEERATIKCRNDLVRWLTWWK